MPSDKCNSITAMGFYCSTSLQPKRCLLVYRSMYNASFFMDLIVSSFVFHSSLLTIKSVDLVVVHDDFLGVTEIVHIFVGTW